MVVHFNEAQQAVINKYNVNIDTGLSTDQAAARREQDGCFNTVPPPLDCPAWVCCLLPCIKHIPSMAAYNQIKPDDAEVLRNKRWIRYDASSLVTGDLIRLQEGDIVPADCVVIQSDADADNKAGTELLVDVRVITGEDKPKSASDNHEQNLLLQLYWGGTILQGSCLAVVTAVGSQTMVAKLIKQGEFPCTKSKKHDTSTVMDEEAGISLMSSKV